jgi:hypothetical protein
MVSYGFLWPMVSYGSLWFLLVSEGFWWFLMVCCCCCFSDSMFACVLPVFSPLFLLALFFPVDLVIPWAWQVYGRVLGKILSESQGQGREDLVCIEGNL